MSDKLHAILAALEVRVRAFVSRIHVPTNPVGQFLFFMIAELIAFGIVTFNFRAIAKGLYFWAAVTDFATLLQSFAIGKLFIEDHRHLTWYTGLGSTLGGTLGTLLSIWLTKHVFGS